MLEFPLKTTLVTGLACALGCSRVPAGAAEAQPSAAVPAASAVTTASARTKTETVTMNGVRWEAAMPEAMRPPAYKITDPEYFSDHMSLGMTSSFPKFDSVEKYIKYNVSTKVLDREQVGDAVLLRIAPQGSDEDSQVYIQALVPRQPIGWTCSGPQSLEADVRAMCRSVRFRKA
jgi:hypothetical protein